MIDVFQVYKIAKIFDKPDYNSESRSEFFKIKDQLISHNGFLKENTLLLPLDKKADSKILESKLLIIQDFINPDSSRLTGGLNHFSFKDTKTPRVFEIFKIKKTENSSYELFLNYSGNELFIGVPKRLDHKIAEVTINQSISYKINGKSDFTLTAGKQRTFTELEYIITFIGVANHIEFKDLNQIECIKQIPAKPIKTIDERKILK